MKPRRRIPGRVLGCVLVLFLASCSQTPSPTSTKEAAEAAKPSASAATGLTAAEIMQETPHELAQDIFKHHGCSSCHTLTEQGKFGYTARGQQIRQGGEGCIDLLTAMNVIAETSQDEWTGTDRTKADHFRQYGCTFCHQITPGKLGLTAVGGKLVDLHMSCPDVERLLNEPKE